VSRALQRSFNALARLALRNGTKAIKLALKPAKKPRRPVMVKPRSARPVTAKRVLAAHPRKPAAKSANTAALTALGQWTTGVASGAGGARRYRLFKPSGVLRGERLPLVVMLHGCAQDAQAFAASSKMNRLA